jgi:tetratricopeptide (TPR) repeat protein
MENAPRREASNVCLVAMIYYNRGVEQLRRREFSAAVAANYKAIWLDPQSDLAAGNLLAAVNNWALDLSEGGELVAALALLEKGLWIAPRHRPLVRNYAALCGRWVDQLVDARRYTEALEFLDDVEARHPDEPWFEAARAEVYRHRGATSATTSGRRNWHLPTNPTAARNSHGA